MGTSKTFRNVCGVVAGATVLLGAAAPNGWASGPVPATSPAAVHASTAAGCQLPNGVKHVVSITFDNVHFFRDNPNVPSDLEQMPNLLNFLLENGVVSGNHHTPLISHTAHDIVTALTKQFGGRGGHLSRSSAPLEVRRERLAPGVGGLLTLGCRQRHLH